jgi:hypothetical protein
MLGLREVTSLTDELEQHWKKHGLGVQAFVAREEIRKE